MKQKVSDRLMRFELPDDLHARLVNLGYRPLDMSKVQLLEQYRLYITQRSGVNYFAAVDEQQRPIPLLTMGPLALTESTRSGSPSIYTLHVPSA